MEVPYHCSHRTRRPPLPSNNHVECDAIYIDADMIAFGAAIYDWSHKETTAAMTVATIPAGVAWNQWAGKSAGGQDAGTCGSLGTCNNAYTKVVHVFDEDNCWPRSKAIPVLGNAASPDAQMALCANTIKHLLGKKPLGAFVLSPTEQLEYSLLKTPVVTCGNAFINGGEIDASKVQLPFLNVEGGGGTFGFPWTYGEETGMCYTGNPALGDGYKVGGERYGGSVTTEEYGHTIFDIGISQFDPQGWMAVQKAEAAAYGKWQANNADKGGHARDPDWDCHTASTEYFAAGAEMLLYNTRIGPNHKATTRTELRDNDPNLWCLAARYYEINNKFAVCPAGPALEDVAQTVDCKAQLEALGVTTFGPEGTGGAKLGGAKTDSSAIVSSTAMCQTTGTTCAAYVASSPQDDADNDLGRGPEEDEADACSTANEGSPCGSANSGKTCQCTGRGGVRNLLFGSTPSITCFCAA